MTYINETLKLGWHWPGPSRLAAFPQVSRPMQAMFFPGRIGTGSRNRGIDDGPNQDRRWASPRGYR